MSCVSCAEAQAAEHFGARQSSYCIALAKGQIRQLPGSSSASEAGEEEGSACAGAGCGKCASSQRLCIISLCLAICFEAGCMVRGM